MSVSLVAYSRSIYLSRPPFSHTQGALVETRIVLASICSRNRTYNTVTSSSPVRMNPNLVPRRQSWIRAASSIVSGVGKSHIEVPTA